MGEPLKSSAMPMRRSAAHRVSRFTACATIVSYVTQNGERMICVFEAPDAEAVRRPLAATVGGTGGHGEARGSNGASASPAPTSVQTMIAPVGKS